MATIDIWIQIENHAWDTVPHRFDRMTGQDFNSGSVLVNLTSPVTHATRSNVRMYKPLMDGANVGEALILRRYTPNWAAPDDRKVNPWDLNEPDPTDSGTMGTIPGPVIECNVGDSVLVHFRNMDSRAGKSVKARAHSLHPHGFVFKPTSDGAYPLTPPDTTQPVAGPPDETALWTAVGVTGPNKMGDRVPPGGTFTYEWNTFGWPTTAGVWLYHDHSICDMENVNLGAIGIIIIHNPADTNNDFTISAADLPGGSLTGSPVVITCFPFPTPLPIGILPHDLTSLGSIRGLSTDMGGTGGMGGMSPMAETLTGAGGKKPKPPAAAPKRATNVGPPVLERLIDRGGMLLEADLKFTSIARFCVRNYRTPPSKALYLQLFHELTGAPGMAINGRVFLGNTPTMVAGTGTLMRFGVVGMGDASFHTFHIHGHRWIIPGPHGNVPNPAIQNSPMDTPVSQFEDTRIFGPANSFVFTINGASGSFMRAGSPSSDDAKGEWHMHCHVLAHMMSGMMGSLLIIGGGETAGALPMGEPCPTGMTAQPNTVTVKNIAFSPSMLAVPSGTTVIFDFQESPHTVTTTGRTGAASAIEINGGPGGNNPANAGVPVPFPPEVQKSVVVTGNPGDMINYMCGIHGAGMAGMIQII
ncbi:MAG TPA: multicopper oxidase domain-containing protein [Pyrinomonadaceae bacterium]|nr:multicopper oxidase domain-containing protein [Pyrinomonadaceae bacterium]